MNGPRQAEFNLRGSDGELFFLLKDKFELEFGPLNNSQVIRMIMLAEAKRKHIKFKFNREG